MSGSSEPNLMEGIRDVFEAYKLLALTTSKPDSSFVVKHLAKIFGNESAQRSGSMGSESKALAKISIVFQAYSKLSKWAPEDASEILIEHLENVLGMKDIVSPQSSEDVQVKEKIVARDDDVKTVFMDVQASEVAPCCIAASSPEMMSASSSSRPLTLAEVTLEQAKQVPFSSQDKGQTLQSASTDRSTLVRSGRASRHLKQVKLVNRRKCKFLKTSKLQKSLKTHVKYRIKLSEKRKKIPSKLSSLGIASLNNEASSRANEETATFGSPTLDPVNSSDEPVAKSLEIHNGNSAAAAVQVLRNSSNKTFPEILLAVKDSIQKEVKACLQKTGSPYTLSSRGSTFFCHICKDKKFRRLDLLAAHIWSEHTKEIPSFNCPYPHCDLKYKHPFSFTHHVKMCKRGKQTHNKKSDIRKPAVGKSEAPKPTVGKSFAPKERSKKVNGSRPSQKVGIKESHFCSHCDKVYPSQAALKFHVASYTKPNSFVCKYCGRSFFHLSSLTMHERVHTGEKPFKCTYCQKRFSQAGNLKTHEKTHFSAKKHECKVCHKKFHQKGNLKTHEGICSSRKGLPLSPKF